MAGIGGDIFGMDKAGGGDGKMKKPTNEGAIAGTFDPNYQVIHINFRRENYLQLSTIYVNLC